MKAMRSKDDMQSMVCPECFGKLSVKDTRGSEDEPNAIVRRRACNECGAWFVTVEKIVRRVERKKKK